MFSSQTRTLFCADSQDSMTAVET